MDDLIERAYRGRATRAEQERLAEWRARDANNERQYLDVIRVLDAAAELRGELRSASPPTAAELLGRRATAGGAEPGVRREARPPVAPSTLRPGRWRRRVPWAVAGAAVLLLVVQTVVSVLDRAEPVGHAADVVTGAGEIVTVQLADGTAVRLAPSSRLRLGNDGDPRVVTLEGRAFFSVAKVEGHPFRVHTRAATATVLGTRFEIQVREDDLRLVVVDGRVALEAPENRVEVAAGQVSAVSNRIAAAPTPAGDVDDVVRWTGTFLAFQGTPLRDAAREITATYGVPVTVTDSLLARQTITAVFTGQSLTAVMDVVCAVVDATCEIDPEEVVVSPR